MNFLYAHAKMSKRPPQSLDTKRRGGLLPSKNKSGLEYFQLAFFVQYY